MKCKFISKIIAGTIVSTTLFTLVPLKASAEWVNDYQGNWYYMQDNQRMTGWARIDGQLYYFDDNGKMQTGWLKAGSSWYFLQNNGTLKIGWINYNKKWYYADSSGAIQTGIVNISGKIYAFDSNGVMKTSNTIINGEFYTIGADGEIVGAKVPTPDKEYDSSGNCIQVIKNTDNDVINSPTTSSFNEVIEDKTESDDSPNEGRTFKVQLKDSNGADLKSKTIKYGKSVDLYEPTKEGYNFAGWNTKSNGSGKSYSADDSIKVKEDIILYAQWTDDTTVYVDSISVKGSSNVVVNKTIQMTAEVSPTDAANTSVTWSVDDTSKAKIDSNGVLTGISSGKVTVTATAKDGSKVSGTKEVTVGTTEVIVPVTGITVTSSTGVNEITADKGTLEMKASVSPSDASNQVVKWTEKDNTGSATIDPDTGKLTAKSNGTVTVTATVDNYNDDDSSNGSSNDFSKSVTVTISGQSSTVPVESVSIGKTTTDTTTDEINLSNNGGTLQLYANISPTYASNKKVTWSIIGATDADGNTVSSTDITKIVKMTSTGLLTAVADGVVTVQVKTADGGMTATRDVKISGQLIEISKITLIDPITITGTSPVDMNTFIDKIEGVNSKTPTNTTLKWTVENKTGSASVNSTTNELTPLSDGIVTIKAAATDGSGVTATKDIEISGTNNEIAISTLTVATATGATSAIITTDDGTADFLATVAPTYASTDPANVTWSVINGNDGGSALIDSVNGNKVTVKAVSNGTVTVKATLKDIKDNTTKTATATVKIYKQIQQVNGIVIDAPANGGIVGVNEGLLMTAKVNGGDSQYQNVNWQVSNGVGDTGRAQFDSTINGLLKGLSKGTVTVIAVSTDGYNLTSDPIKIEVVDPQYTNSVTVNLPKDSYNNDINTISTNKGTLTLTAAVDSSATSNVVTWSVEPVTGTVNGAGKANIVDNHNSTATITAVENGDVRVIATASGGKVGEQIITISGQDATGITVSSSTGVSSINKIGDALDMAYALTPSGAIEPSSVTWSVSDTSKATITPSADKKTAKLEALDNGTVTVTATATTANGVKLVGSTPVTINGVKSVTISNGSVKISGGSATVNNGGTLTLNAAVLPTTVKDGSVAWSVSDNSKGTITYSADTKTALFTANATGTVIITATANGDTTVSSSATITIK